MPRLIVSVALMALLSAGGQINMAWSAELKVIQTHKTKEMVITLMSESGQLTKGHNSFVLEFTSSTTKQRLDVGKVAFDTSMAMPGMAPMVAGATITLDKVPGRYLATITFQDTGTRQVTLTWDGPAGKGSTRFSVPVL